MGKKIRLAGLLCAVGLLVIGCSGKDDAKVGGNTTVVNVARMMSNRARTNDERFLVLPGDRLFVPERLF